MAAPGIAQFGDGSHAPGATAVPVQGGGFGAFPGSVWIYQNADRTGSADELTVTAWNGVEATVDIPGSLTNTAGTRYLFLQRSDLAWSNAFAFTLEAAGEATLTVQNASHGHTAGNVALTQANTLAVQSATHAHAAGSVALTQAHTLAVQNAAHGHSADNVEIASGTVLAVAHAAHGHTAQAPSLTQANVLAAQDASHAHAAGSPALTQANTLAVSSAQHGHSAGLVTLRIPGGVPPRARVFVAPRRGKVAVEARRNKVAA